MSNNVSAEAIGQRLDDRNKMEVLENVRDVATYRKLEMKTHSLDDVSMLLLSPKDFDLDSNLVTQLLNEYKDIEKTFPGYSNEKPFQVSSSLVMEKFADGIILTKDVLDGRLFEHEENHIGNHFVNFKKLENGEFLIFDMTFGDEVSIEGDSNILGIVVDNLEQGFEILNKLYGGEWDTLTLTRKLVPRKF